MKEYEKPKVLRELHCPYCLRSVGVIGEQTETHHQHTDYCRHCNCTFTVNNFKATIYTRLGGVKHE